MKLDKLHAEAAGGATLHLHAWSTGSVRFPLRCSTGLMGIKPLAVHLTAQRSLIQVDDIHDCSWYLLAMLLIVISELVSVALLNAIRCDNDRVNFRGSDWLMAIL